MKNAGTGSLQNAEPIPRHCIEDVPSPPMLPEPGEGSLPVPPMMHEIARHIALQTHHRESGPPKLSMDCSLLASLQKGVKIWKRWL